MNTTKAIFGTLGLGMVLALQSEAALIPGLSSYQSGPYYADFNSGSGLDVNYVLTSGNSSSGTGVLTISDPYSSGQLVSKQGTYTSSTDSPGTGSGSGLGPYNAQTYSGLYKLTANISYSDNGAVATLTSGSTFEIDGNLLGGTASTLLLKGNLVTGAGGTDFGFVDHQSGTMTSGEYDTFDFLINLGSVTGNNNIVSDFDLNGPGTVGGIILNAGFDYTGHQSGGHTVYNVNNGLTTTTANTFPAPTSYGGFDGYWNQAFANPLAGGQANTFVPESAAYPWAASLAAVLACGIRLGRRTFGLAKTI